MLFSNKYFYKKYEKRKKVEKVSGIFFYAFLRLVFCLIKLLLSIEIHRFALFYYFKCYNDTDSFYLNY